MKFTIATLVTLAISVAALPPSAAHKSGKITLAQASGQCQAGKISCCNPTKEVSADGIAGNLLAEGLLNNLLGTRDSSCASQSLIKNLNLLGFTEEGQEGTTCKNVIACCPTGGDCKAIEA